VKSLFQRLGVEAKIVELDELADGDKVQAALGEVTGRRTVPQVRAGDRERRHFVQDA
jgi:glutaredoxin 3